MLEMKEKVVGQFGFESKKWCNCGVCVCVCVRVSPEGQVVLSPQNTCLKSQEGL